MERLQAAIEKARAQREGLQADLPPAAEAAPVAPSGAAASGAAGPQTGAPALPVPGAAAPSAAELAAELAARWRIRSRCDWM